MLRRLALALPIVASLVLAAALNGWALKYPARLDLTSGRVYSMSEETRRVIASLSQPVTITFFHDTRSRAMQDARYLLEQYARASPLIRLRQFDPVLQPAAAAREQVRFAGTTIFESAGRRVMVNAPGENEFTNGLIRVSSDAAGRVCFTDGHNESNPASLQAHDHFEQGGRDHGHDHASGGRALTLHERHGMGMASNALETLGYAVEQRRLTSGPVALAGCAVTVVASPQVPFEARERAQLAQFIAAGGPALLLLEPAVDHGLSELLATYGIAVTADPVTDPEQHYWTDKATPAVSDYARHKVTRNLPLSFFPGVAALVPDPESARWADIRITPLVQTGPGASVTHGADTLTGPLTLMLEAVRRGAAGARDVRVVVAGDGDFATNSFFGALGNGRLFLNAVSHLADHENLIDITPRHYVVAELSMSNAGLRATFLLTTLTGPFGLACAGAWVWRRRR